MTSKMLVPGYVYILRNPVYPETIVKIGRTQVTVEERVAQISRPVSYREPPL